MEYYIVYLFKATVCLIAFSVFFRLLLMRETFFRFTRFTLISGLIVCSVLPFVKLTLGKPHVIQQTVYQIEELLLPERPTEVEIKSGLPENDWVAGINPEAAVPQSTDTGSNTRPVSQATLLMVVYWLGAGAMLLRLGFSFASLFRLLRKSRRIESGEYELIISPGNVVPFSFFRYIVLSEKDYLENPEEVILHEKMHIRKKHNIDVIFSELFLAVHWFNPMAWLLCRDLREIHEYEADNAVIETGIEAQKYQLLLVKKAVGERRFTSVVNGFNQSKIKNRITMMLKTESSRWARFKVLFAVPLVVVALLAFAQPGNVQDELVSYQERKDAADYFLSVRKVEKENYLAYLYLDAKGRLFLMSENAGSALMQVVDVNERPDLVEVFSGLITRKISGTTSAPVDFILGAENDTPMQSVTLVKDAVRKAYSGWCGGVSKEKNVSSKEVKEEFPLSITFTSLQAGEPESIVKQVQSNPFFYWEQVQRYCREKGIGPKDVNFRATDNRNLISILINSVNAVMYINHYRSEWFKTKEEGLSDQSVEVLKNMIVETIEKNSGNPVYVSLQNDRISSTDFVITFINQVLPLAYEEALKDISGRKGIPFDELKESKPLLLLYTVPRVFGVDEKRGEFQVRTSTKKQDMEEMAFLSGVRIREGNDTGIASLEWMAVNEYDSDLLKEQKITVKDSAPLGPVDNALVIVDEKMGQSDVTGIQKMLSKEGKLVAKKTCFVLGLNE
ncbi:MAG: M56 family metallopeptidase [Petrimonas sp.]|nr:M56 family metallopeptidase [Petrimonas sp.]